MDWSSNQVTMYFCLDPPLFSENMCSLIPSKIQRPILAGEWLKYPNQSPGNMGMKDQEVRKNRKQASVSEFSQNEIYMFTGDFSFFWSLKRTNNCIWHTGD